MLSADLAITALALAWTISREIVLQRLLRRQVKTSLAMLARASRLIGDASVQRMEMAGDIEHLRAERDCLRAQNAALRLHCGAPPELMFDDMGAPL